MKTKEQVQQELNTYLTKTSQHVFVSGEKNDKFLRVVEATTMDGEKIWFSRATEILCFGIAFGAIALFAFARRKKTRIAFRRHL